MLILATATSFLSAAELLDQQNDFVSSIGDSVGPFGTEVAQTFTVGTSGTLSRIKVKMLRAGPALGSAVLTVYSTAGGIPTAVLGTSSASSALMTGMPSLITFDLSSSSISASANDVLAFGVKSGGDITYILPQGSESYAGGNSTWRSLGPPPEAWNLYSPTHDYGFETYVEVTQQSLPGDYNADHVVDAADFVVWRDNFGAANEAALNGNGDGMNGVDEGDYTRWKANFGATNGAGTNNGAASFAEVPEPATWMLVVGCTLGLIRHRMKPLALDSRPSALD